MEVVVEVTTIVGVEVVSVTAVTVMEDMEAPVVATTRENTHLVVEEEIDQEATEVALGVAQIFGEIQVVVMVDPVVDGVPAVVAHLPGECIRFIEMI